MNINNDRYHMDLARALSESDATERSRKRARDLEQEELDMVIALSASEVLANSNNPKRARHNNYPSSSSSSSSSSSPSSSSSSSSSSSVPLTASSLLTEQTTKVARNAAFKSVITALETEKGVTMLLPNLVDIVTEYAHPVLDAQISNAFLDYNNAMISEDKRRFGEEIALSTKKQCDSRLNQVNKIIRSEIFCENPRASIVQLARCYNENRDHPDLRDAIRFIAAFLIDNDKNQLESLKRVETSIIFYSYTA